MKTAPVLLRSTGSLPMAKFGSLGICALTFPVAIPPMEPNYKFGLAVTETLIKDGITPYVWFLEGFLACIMFMNSGGITKFPSPTTAENVWICPAAVKLTVTEYVSSSFARVLENLTLSLRFKSGIAPTILIKCGMLDTLLRTFPNSRKAINTATIHAEQARVKLPTVKLHGSSLFFSSSMIIPLSDC